jgi:hypothetical protein
MKTVNRNSVFVLGRHILDIVEVTFTGEHVLDLVRYLGHWERRPPRYLLENSGPNKRIDHPADNMFYRCMWWDRYGSLGLSVAVRYSKILLRRSIYMRTS